MPYDPRPVSEGGNRGIDERFSRNAPEGKFRVVGVDTFDGDDWLEGDFDSLELAREHIEKKTEGKQMLVMYVYNDSGQNCAEGGRF